MAGEDRRPPLCGRCWTSIVRFTPPWCVVCGTPFATFPVEVVDLRRPPPSLQAGAAPALAQTGDDGLSGAGRPEECRSGGGVVCGSCVGERPPFSYARSAGRYEGVLRRALHAFKFRGQTGLGPLLAELLFDVYLTGPPAATDLVVPVPLHPARERTRGFNQSVLLAKPLARRLGLPCLPRVLRRQRPTRPQVDLTGSLRRQNVRGAFDVASPTAVWERRVLLVDDVLTTGATVSECAQTLLRAGASAVGVVTVARA